MRFRGHETFAIRKGWLNKGIKNKLMNEYNNIILKDLF